VQDHGTPYPLLPSFEASIPNSSDAISLDKSFSLAGDGEVIEVSQRRFRFQQWRRFIEEGGYIAKLAYLEVPKHLTRMRAVQRDIPGAMLMDTSSAAIWGALCDEKVAAHQEEGVIIVNVGNQHTVGALLRGERVWGLFEHHTVLMTPEKIVKHVESLRDGSITNEEVYNDGGHGAFVHPDYKGGFRFIAVTGPRRRMAPYYMAVPYGDMMLVGAFGLVAAARRIGLIK
jgi:uncharacterized protein (DUF1786 family)